MNIKYEESRKRLFSKVAKELEEHDAENEQIIKENFNKKDSLSTQIEQNIFPGLVGIKTACGRVGMGFFQHERWLVSNAHVIRHRSEIDEGITLIEYDGGECLLNAEKSFHRPWESVDSPDIVVVNTAETHAVIPDRPLALDNVYPDFYYFYVDLNFDVHYLVPCSVPSQLPLLFRGLDEHILQEGCSGTPIFSAQLMLSRSPNWKFATIGALYARFVCASTSTTSLLACVVPIVQEFEQIRSSLLASESAERKKQHSTDYALLGDTQRSLKAHTTSEQEQTLTRQVFRAFEAGDSMLEIGLPEGVEKLAKNTFVSLEQSYLRKTAKLSLEEIKKSFGEFVSALSEEKSIAIYSTTGRESTLQSSEFWRLDTKCGTNGKYWVLQVQDNTGKGVKVRGTQKSASSVFAEVKVPIKFKYINGTALGIYLQESQARAHTKENLLTKEKLASGVQRKVIQQQAKNIIVSIVAESKDCCFRL